MLADESIKNYLPSNFMPSERDVVCARGKEAYLHPGNNRYRDIITNNLSKYTGAESKNEKSAIVMTIVEEVRCDAPAGFVRHCDKEQLWYEIGDEAAREKVGQTIRETLTQRDPAKRAKKRIKRAMNKAKRVAAMEALELEPLPVDQAMRMDLNTAALGQPAASSLPLPLISSQLIPTALLREASVGQQQPPLQRRSSASADNALRFQPQQHSAYTQLQSTAALNASALLQFSGQSLPFPYPSIFPSANHRPPTSTGLRFNRDQAPQLSSSRPMIVKDLEPIAVTAPSSRYGRASREWSMEDGYQMQDSDFEEIEQLFDERRVDRSLLSLSAAA